MKGSYWHSVSWWQRMAQKPTFNCWLFIIRIDLFCLHPSVYQNYQDSKCFLSQLNTSIIHFVLHPGGDVSAWMSQLRILQLLYKFKSTFLQGNRSQWRLLGRSFALVGDAKANSRDQRSRLLCPCDPFPGSQTVVKTGSKHGIPKLLLLGQFSFGSFGTLGTYPVLCQHLVSVLQFSNTDNGLLQRQQPTRMGVMFHTLLATF